MPEFVYTALDPSGQEVSGQLSAVSEDEALSSLKNGGHFLLKIEELRGERESRGELNLDSLRSLLEPARKKHTPLLFRQLAVLLDSGVSIIRALSILENQAGPFGVRKMVNSIRNGVESGETLSHGLEAYPAIFSPYVVNMIRAAELSGEMEMAMTRVADQLESSAEFKRQMITSLIYPGIVVFMATAVIAILTLVVIPKFQPMLGDGKSLPWATQTIMDASTWMQEYWWLLFGGIGGTVLGMVLFRKTQEGSFIVDNLLLRIPVIGGIIRCGIVVTFSRNLSMLFASGVSLVDALETVRNTLNNGAAVKVLDNMVNRILEGESMSAPLAASSHIFPPMVSEMVRTGEETGEIVKVLELTADIFQKILESNVKRMNALVEPLLIAVLGGIVGFVFYGLISGMLAVYGL